MNVQEKVAELIYFQQIDGRGEPRGPPGSAFTVQQANLLKRAGALRAEAAEIETEVEEMKAEAIARCNCEELSQDAHVKLYQRRVHGGTMGLIWQM
jgi:hypothetical protein